MFYMLWRLGKEHGVLHQKYEENDDFLRKIYAKHIEIVKRIEDLEAEVIRLKKEHTEITVNAHGGDAHTTNVNDKANAIVQQGKDNEQTQKAKQ